MFRFGVNHIIKNFQLYGLDCQSSSFIQITKELLDNSIDACRNVNYPNISLKVSDHPSVKSMMILEVTDNGCGMSDPQMCIVPFYTSKSDEIVDTVGTFGVGLTVSMLYSLLETNECIRLISKVRGAEYTSVLDFSFDSATVELIVKRSNAVQFPAYFSGSKVSLSLRKVGSEGLLGVIKCIEKYNLLPHEWSLDININVSEYDMYQGCEKYLKLEPFNKGDCRTAVNPFLCECPLILPTEGGNDVISFTSSADSFEIELFLFSQKRSNTSSECGIRFMVERFANHSPMLYCDSFECNVVEGLLSYNWMHHGKTIENKRDKEQFMLELRDLPDLEMCDDKNITYFMFAIIHFNNPKVRFTSLKKNGLKLNPQQKTHFHTAVRNAIVGMRSEMKKRNMSDIFLTRREYENRRLFTVYIPHVANALRKIILSISKVDEKFYERISTQYISQFEKVHDAASLENMFKQYLEDAALKSSSE